MRPTREGYLLIDHRACPDLAPTGMPPVFESATQVCSHCQRVVVMNPLRTRERHKCRRCFKYVCDDCAPVDACRPFVQKLDEALSAIEHGNPIPLLTNQQE